jgi:hypothetical protein
MLIPGNIVICGIVHNNSDYLPRVFQKLTKLEQIFENQVRYVFYENDSTDSSATLLKAFVGSKGIVETEKNMKKQYPERTRMLCYARNQVHTLIEENFPDTDYVINMDMDNVNLNLQIDMVHKVFMDYNNWDIVTSNQKDFYYDLWALRTKSQNVNCWRRHQKCSRLKLYYFFPWTRWVNNIPINEPHYIPVLSAFGGFGIYKYQFWKVGKYNGIGQFNEQDCEHVAFHESIREKYPNIRIVIAPYLINC